MIRVSKAKALDDFTLEILFNNGLVKSFDMKPYLKYPVFQSLKELNKFKNVSVAYGTVQWGNDLDISPDTLYLESVEIEKLVNV
jgi:hypothetical protein